MRNVYISGKISNNPKEWIHYMLDDILLIKGCHGMYMLKNWHSSIGARIEHMIAEKLELEIMYQ